jgi:hypothetical protein
MNPYAPPSSDIVIPMEPNRFLLGLKRASIAVMISSTACVALAFVAKAIDWTIPGDGALHDATINGILRATTFVFTVVVMISFFSTFAFYSGGKRLNAGFCVIVIFLSGLLAAWLLACIGFESPRRLRMEHPPLYVSEFLLHFFAYMVTSGVLTIVGNSRARKNTRPNNPMDRSGGSAAFWWKTYWPPLGHRWRYRSQIMLVARGFSMLMARRLQCSMLADFQCSWRADFNARGAQTSMLVARRLPMLVLRDDHARPSTHDWTPIGKFNLSDLQPENLMQQ